MIPIHHDIYLSQLKIDPPCILKLLPRKPCMDICHWSNLVSERFQPSRLLTMHAISTGEPS